MEPDPLEERLDTIFDGLDAEKVAVVPTEVPSTIEDVLTALECQEGVQSVSLGRQARVASQQNSLDAARKALPLTVLQQQKRKR